MVNDKQLLWLGAFIFGTSFGFLVTYFLMKLR